MARDGVPVGPELAALVARVHDGARVQVRAECAQLGVSTKTLYKYLARFAEEGVEGFYPRSRRPLSSPTRVGAEPGHDQPDPGAPRADRAGAPAVSPQLASPLRGCPAEGDVADGRFRVRPG